MVLENLPNFYQLKDDKIVKLLACGSNYLDPLHNMIRISGPILLQNSSLKLLDQMLQRNQEFYYYLVQIERHFLTFPFLPWVNSYITIDCGSHSIGLRDIAFDKVMLL